MTSIRITKPIRDRLASLEQAHGRLTPSVVVTDAKKKTSPLHCLFVWDMKTAAERYWLDRAREIIQNVKLVASQTETVVIDAPHYVRDPLAGPSEQGYVSIDVLRGDPQLARASLRIEFERVIGALARARSIAVALGLQGEVEDLLVHVIRVREQSAA